MKRIFIFKLKIRGAKKPFKKGWEPGVIATQELTVDLPKNYSKTMIAAGLLDEEEKFIKENIEVEWEEKK